MHGCNYVLLLFFYFLFCESSSSVIRQRGESQDGCFKKTKHAKFSEKRTFLGGKKCLFFGKFGVLRFPETPVLRFALLPYYRRVVAKV